MLLNGTFLANLLATFTLLAQSNGAPVDGSPWDGPLDFPTPYKPVSELVGAKSTMHPVQLDFTIHPSCNVKQTQNLRHAFVELRKVATAASTYIQTHGPKDPLIIKYFGRISPADIKVARATFNRIAQGDKTGLIFRCDDPDKKCAKNKDWNGHWRESKAPNETVVCNNSFETRLGLEKVCEAGVDDINKYWAIDLIHRSLHLPPIGKDGAQDFADDYDEILELADKDPKRAVRNAHTLQAFAFDIVSRSRKHPDGCIEELDD